MVLFDLSKTNLFRLGTPKTAVQFRSGWKIDFKMSREISIQDQFLITAD